MGKIFRRLLRRGVAAVVTLGSLTAITHTAAAQERYTSVFDVGDAQRIAATINGGGAGSWCCAYVGPPRFVGNDQSGQPVYAYDVYAQAGGSSNPQDDGPVSESGKQ